MEFLRGENAKRRKLVSYGTSLYAALLPQTVASLRSTPPAHPSPVRLPTNHVNPLINILVECNLQIVVERTERHGPEIGTGETVD